MQTSRVTFQCRFYLIDDQVYEMKCWRYELDPMTEGRRSNEEWAYEHMRDYSPEQLREMFTLVSDKDYQVLFTGTITGKENYFFGEYDEDMEIDQSVIERVPEEFANYFTQSQGE